MGRCIGVFERIATQEKSPPYDTKQVLTDMDAFLYSNELSEKMQDISIFLIYKKMVFCCGVLYS